MTCEHDDTDAFYAIFFILKVCITCYLGNDFFQKDV